MDDLRSASELSVRLCELSAGLADPDCDLDALADIEEQLIAARRRESPDPAA
ncbi:hypothetical protein ACWD7C_25100 [Streptomyces sp. NPDC005134]|uniref:hypothetical protein n=1 Tax=unclassified Streptomyces TaxID=2593676 RepID=UPI0033BA0863